MLDRTKIVVSVDDFGIRKVAAVILPLAKAGKLDRVSVLIRFMTSPLQVEELKQTPVSIDLHLDLIEVLKSGEKEKESVILRGVNFWWRLAFGYVTQAKARARWKAQIEQFKEVFGRYPDGLNTHEHLHYFPQFFPVVMELAQEYGIGFVRLGKQGILLPKRHFSLVAKILAGFWKKDRAVYAPYAKDIATTDFVVSYDWVMREEEFLTQLPEGVTEVVLHPERKNEYDFIDKHF
jgi:predicted glycoside hydrolase/deacetylase ChbG (UPF0249 family)